MSMHIHRRTISLEAIKSREVKVTANDVYHVVSREDREALQLEIEVMQQSEESFHERHVPANALPPPVSEC